MLERLFGLEIEDRTAVGGPLAAAADEHGRDATEIADRFDVFHAAALDGFETNGGAVQSEQLATGSICRQAKIVMQLARRPSQAARHAGCIR